MELLRYHDATLIKKSGGELPQYLPFLVHTKMPVPPLLFSFEEQYICKLNRT